MERQFASRDGEADQRETERLTITPHPLRTHIPDPILSPETPHPNVHSRQLSESKQLLPQSSKSLFQYSSTTAVDFGEAEVLDGYGNYFPKWNSEPQTLRRSRRERWRDAGVDLLITFLVLPFFALAGAIIRVNGKAPEGNQEEIFKQCIYIVCHHTSH